MLMMNHLNITYHGMLIRILMIIIIHLVCIMVVVLKTILLVNQMVILQ